VSPASTLAPRLTIEEIVRVYNECVAQIRGGYAMVSAAEQRLNDVFVMEGRGSISAARNHRISFANPSDALMEVRHAVWSSIIERLEVRRMMSVARARELDEQLRQHKMPEITHETVAQLLKGFFQNLDKMLEEAVEEVFDWLRPPRSEYKSNSEYEVPRKVVLGHIAEPWGKFHNRWSVSYGGYADTRLTALENVFSALDGQGKITKTHYSAISTVIRSEGYAGEGETPYFKFRTFHNGNMHMWMKRADLLARFNQIAGGKRLRAPAP
jgi:hypothetical protein